MKYVDTPCTCLLRFRSMLSHRHYCDRAVLIKRDVIYTNVLRKYSHLRQLTQQLFPSTFFPLYKLLLTALFAWYYTYALEITEMSSASRDLYGLADPPSPLPVERSEEDIARIISARTAKNQRKKERKRNRSSELLTAGSNSEHYADETPLMGSGINHGRLFRSNLSQQTPEARSKRHSSFSSWHRDSTGQEYMPGNRPILLHQTQEQQYVQAQLDKKRSSRPYRHHSLHRSRLAHEQDNQSVSPVQQHRDSYRRRSPLPQGEPRGYTQENWRYDKRGQSTYSGNRTEPNHRYRSRSPSQQRPDRRDYRPRYRDHFDHSQGYSEFSQSCAHFKR